MGVNKEEIIKNIETSVWDLNHYAEIDSLTTELVYADFTVEVTVKRNEPIND